MNSRLLELYQATSKHSNYQILARSVETLLPPSQLEVRSRYERERLAFIRRYVQLEGARLADIGGNTGFFSFEALDAGAASVDYHEGNLAHCEFVRGATAALDLEDRLHAHHGYVDFPEPDVVDTDCMILLNVLHHVGDDYGEAPENRHAVQQFIVASLKHIARLTDTLVLQIGFNWKGDPALPLLDHGTKQEMIDLVARATPEFRVVATGIAVRDGDAIRYADLDAENVQRDDSLGEFLNRPVFVLESTVRSGTRP